MKKYKLFLLVLVTVLWTACSDESEEQGNNSNCDIEFTQTKIFKITKGPTPLQGYMLFEENKYIVEIHEVESYFKDSLGNLVDKGKELIIHQFFLKDSLGNFKSMNNKDVKILFCRKEDDFELTISNNYDSDYTLSTIELDNDTHKSINQIWKKKIDSFNNDTIIDFSLTEMEIKYEFKGDVIFQSEVQIIDLNPKDYNLSFPFPSGKILSANNNNVKYVIPDLVFDDSSSNYSSAPDNIILSRVLFRDSTYHKKVQDYIENYGDNLKVGDTIPIGY